MALDIGDKSIPSGNTSTTSLVGVTGIGQMVEIPMSVIDAGSFPIVMNRTDLASSSALTSAVYLNESGREGIFVFSTTNFVSKFGSNLSIIDPNQTFYVAPTSDLTGASGAWVRKFNGPVNPEWAGIIRGAAGGANRANNSSSRLALCTVLRARGNTGIFHGGTEPIQFPAADVYEFLGDEEWTDASYDISGAGPAGDDFGTTIDVPDGKSGFIFAAVDSSGATGSRTPIAGTTRASDWSTISNIRFSGNFPVGPIETESHALLIRGHGVRIINCYGNNFAGDFIHSNTAAGSTGSTAGNANNCQVYGGRAINCRNGIYTHNSDTNIWFGMGFDGSSCRAFAIDDDSFLGGTWIGCHADNGGYTAGAIPCVVTDTTFWYVARKGGTWSTPPVTGTSSANWYLIGALGGVNPSLNVALHNPAITYRPGGAYSNNIGGNSYSQFIGCYTEGSQVSQITAPGVITGAGSVLYARGSGVLYGTGTGLATNGDLLVQKNLTATGSQHDIGPQSGSGAGTVINFNYGNTTGGDGKLNFQRPGAGLDGYIWGFNNSFLINASSALGLRIAGVTKFLLDANSFGYSVGSGNFVIQTTSRTTGVTINNPTGQIELVSAAGSTSWQTLTVTNSCVSVTDTVRVCQALGTDKYMIHVTHVGSGLFDITFATTGGTTTEQPWFNFTIIKGQNS